MSAELQLLVWRRFPGRMNNRLALMALAEIADDQGCCSVSQADIGALARMDRSTAVRAVSKLKEDEWITTSRSSVLGGCLVYRINVPKLKALPEFSKSAPNRSSCRVSGNSRSIPEFFPGTYLSGHYKEATSVAKESDEHDYRPIGMPAQRP